MTIRNKISGAWKRYEFAKEKYEKYFFSPGISLEKKQDLKNKMKMAKLRAIYLQNLL